MKICVFGAASPKIDKIYIEQVEELGREMVKRGHSLVFGGGGNGLMGAAARGVSMEGGYIEGVIPSFFENEEIEAVYPLCDMVFETKTMRERKQLMEDLGSPHSTRNPIIAGHIKDTHRPLPRLQVPTLIGHHTSISLTILGSGR